MIELLTLLQKGSITTKNTENSKSNREIFCDFCVLCGYSRLFAVDSLLCRFYELDDEEVVKLCNLFSEGCALDLPREGRVTGSEAIKAYFANYRRWAFKHCALTKCIGLTEQENRIAVEFATFALIDECWRKITTAIVADREEGRISGPIRGYGSTVPILGRKTVRKPLVEVGEKCDHDMPPKLDEYFAGLLAADVERIMKNIAQDCYFQGSQGSVPDTRQGRDEVYGFFRNIPNNEAASTNAILKKCSTTWDGKNFAVEFMVDRWLDGPEIRQAGFAAYRLNDCGDIASIRLYDDLIDAGDVERGYNIQP